MSNFVKLTHDVLNIGDISNLVSDSSTGAISLFIGTTRDHFNNKRVVRLVRKTLHYKARSFICL